MEYKNGTLYGRCIIYRLPSHLIEAQDFGPSTLQAACLIHRMIQASQQLVIN
ncbi:hypothetical protein HMPREF9412_0686 [Paenibacillus sp. HGF5]|nr:hypothetical protein HMPREF9412_0686 [Paenibacillus sp. HGF5]